MNGRIEFICAVKTRLAICCLLLSASFSSADTLADHAVRSPDGRVIASLGLLDGRAGSNCPAYSLQYAGRAIVANSQLGLAIEDASDLGANFTIVKAERRSHRGSWTPVCGERSSVPDNYNELVLDLKEDRKPFRTLRLKFRAYNEGLALCYELPAQKNLRDFVISSENTRFRFTADHTTWPVYSAQGVYSKVPLSKMKKNSERPLTIKIADDCFVAVGEARLVDYARMRLSPVDGRPHTLVSSLASKVKASTPYTTPWRFIMVGDSPGQLLEYNYLLMNLNEPCAIPDTSWIKPGKVIREVTLTTKGGKACVDFAVAHNLQYVEYDAGWYGHEYDEKSDATTITVDPKRSPGPLDLHEVIAYAKSKGIGIIVYVNRRALERQLDEILPLYEKWGIKGVKYGFVQVGSQQWTTWLHDAVRKAADHHLMVDIHDEYRPTGYSRTYPNLMTQEGIRGNECMPTAEENLILPFTRMLCGAGDYTVCYYNNRIKTTHAHQLAASVVYFSPWQFLFWYDRPASYQGEPEIEFFKHVPTVWDDTRVIHGEIGSYTTIARKSDSEWFVGTMNGLDTRELDIPLSFLDADGKYVAHIYSDADPDDGTRTHVAIEKHIVDSSTTLKAKLPAGGGQAVRLVPAASAERQGPHVLKPDSCKHYIDKFNGDDEELYAQHIPNDKAWRFLRDNIPLFECPDEDIERTYYFRWWTYRKHIKHTPDGFVITEFLPKVNWSGKHNTINCPAGHHFYEGRWLHDRKYLDDYAVFWFRKGGSVRSYSFWAADALWARYMVTADKGLIVGLLPDLIDNYKQWQKAKQEPDGLLWQVDDRDGMEVSVGGSGKRATINSYMYADAVAIAKTAELAGKPAVAEEYEAKAKTLKTLVQTKLWDSDSRFFKTLPRNKDQRVDVRELHGYTPWYANLPDPGYESAWKQLMDPKGFHAPFGPTTAEQRHPRFAVSYEGHECQWNGPSWPFATSITLTALANLLNNYQQSVIDKADYFETLGIYTKCHHLKRDDGRIVPWIDENLNPFTGDWIARTRLKSWKDGTWSQSKGGMERGKDYNHSTYCDLIINGLVGLRPRPDDTVEVNPLVPDDAWDWFCLDNVLYHNRIVTIIWDRSGRKYGLGKGLRVFADGRQIAHSAALGRLTAQLPEKETRSSRSHETSAGWLKYDGNPVLGGDLGTCFDVTVLEERGGYRMWFSWRPRESVALVDSSDGIHWSEPVVVLAPNPSSGWEQRINRPVVIKRGHKYHMWYTGQTARRSYIGYATSPDGRTWTRMSDKPVLSPEKPWEDVAVMCPHVVWDEQKRLYRMWYSGGQQYEPNAIGYATSADGLTWKKLPDNPIFAARPGNRWEQHKVTACQVIPAGSRHLMFYIGFRDEHHAQIGLARSADGITNWQRHPANPIIFPGRETWDGDACYKPYAVFEKRADRWLLWYNGRKGKKEQIGLAIHEGQDLGL